MACQLRSLVCYANQPVRLARFWASVLRGQPGRDSRGGVAVRPGEDPGFRLRFLPTREPRAGLNDRHLHLTSTSPADQERTVAAALALGARPLDVGQRPDEGHVVLADPEGNEFCVIEPGNRFLAGCGFLGEIACDGSRRAATSGVRRWAGRWCGTRTRKPRSARRTAVPRSAGAVRR